jgi:hypothetical protein
VLWLFFSVGFTFTLVDEFLSRVGDMFRVLGGELVEQSLRGVQHPPR